MEGLKIKYIVRKVEDGSLVNKCFVLRPDKDEAARKALLAYADATDNKQLAEDIRKWIDDINYNISAINEHTMRCMFEDED